MVCSHILPDEPQSDSGARDLAALARTSRALQEPALNALWRSQETFAHILRCMPSDLWNIPVVSGAVYHLEVVRPLALSDWERPLFYMNRVRILTLSLCLPKEHFFPHINSLVWKN
ncbi:hypothetical protein B0H17DRAFT_1052430 [Mycena rosella]|uniref:Uncharacterized protein n=1 Tax=Mycena rosella TaxID=1033263 RepID=A0AAD7GNE8_MYCRO|nr:hypothetical protein B0H17DRAFT_1052430 [Mycena rosella]